MSGVGRVFRRGRWYHIAYYRHGQQIREPAQTQSAAAARRLLQARIRAQGQPHEERLTFEDLIAAVRDDYTVNRRRTIYDLEHSRVPQLKAVFGGMRLVDINGVRVKRYVAGRLQQQAAPATINRELGVLRRGFKLLQQAGVLSAAPHFPLLKETHVRQGFVSPADFAAIAARLPSYAQPVARFLYLTAWRLSQALSLEWRDVDLRAGEIRARAENVKTGTNQVIPLGTELRAIIAIAEAARSLACPFVFTYQGRRIDRHSYSRVWRRAADRAGFGSITVHDLRRSATRNLVLAGVPETVVMKLTGHRTRSMFDRYAIASSVQLLEAQDRLATYLGEAPKVTKVTKLK